MSKGNTAGEYIAICNRFIDCGDQTGTYNGVVNQSRKIWLSWECHDDDGDVFCHSQFFTLSFNPKSALYKLICGWNGKKFTTSELNNLEASWILGRVGHMKLVCTSEFDERLKIESIAPLAEGVVDPVQKYPNTFFNLSDPDLDVFSKLSSGIQELIKKSPQWKLYPFADDWESELTKRKQAKLVDLNSDELVSN